MKTTLFALLVFAFFGTLIYLDVTNPDTSPIEGYVVGKEYTPEHMSNSTPHRVMQTGVVIVPHMTVAHPPPPHKVHESWVVFVASPRKIEEVTVSKQLFDNTKCGQKVRWNRKT